MYICILLRTCHQQGEIVYQRNNGSLYVLTRRSSIRREDFQEEYGRRRNKIWSLRRCINVILTIRLYEDLCDSKERSNNSE